MNDDIRVATTESDYAAFGDLIREYWAWLQARYSDMPGFIDTIGGHQALEAELAGLAAKYGPPEGKTLLAFREGDVTGAVAYRDLRDGSCEMKRLFVPDRFGGRGTGRLLCATLIDEATADGYRVMRLDTGRQNTEAMKMYESLGFRRCAPFHDYPAELLAHLHFMEKSLGDTVTGAERSSETA